MSSRCPSPLWSVPLGTQHCTRIACGTDGTIWLSLVSAERAARSRGDSPDTQSPGFSINENGSTWLETGPDCRLVGINPSGTTRYTVDECALVACLDGGAILAANSRELLRFDHADRLPVARMAIPARLTVHYCPGMLAVDLDGRIRLLSEFLELQGEFDAPKFAWSRVAADGFWAAERLRVLHCDWNGHVSDFATIPAAEVEAEIARVCPLGAWIGMDGKSKFWDFKAEGGTDWVVSADAAEDLVFVCNRLPGFTVCCFTRAGKPLWTRCLSSGCCGYRVHALPNGLFAASSGCGGTVSWFDRDGNVLAKSEPLRAPGIGHMLGSDLQIASDSGVFAERLDGTLLGFDGEGHPLWELATGPACCIGKTAIDSTNGRVYSANCAALEPERAGEVLAAWAL